MNTHDKYELPPLPEPSGHYGNHYCSEDMQSYARAAIEPYAKRIAELEAERQQQYRPVYEEGWKDALEWADRQRRGEPVAASEAYDTIDSFLRNNLGDDDYALYSSALDEVYTAPQSAEPVKCLDPSMGEHACSNRAQCWEPCGELGKSIEHAKVAGPVKVPSDADLLLLWEEVATGIKNTRIAFARALLARYGQPVQPAASAEPIGYVDPLYVECRKRGLPFNAKVYSVPTEESTKAVYTAPVAVQPTGKPPLQVAAQPSVPDGYAIIPIEPTEEMKDAAMEVLLHRGDIYQNEFEQIVVETITPRHLLKAMIDAAPIPPATEQAQQVDKPSNLQGYLVDKSTEMQGHAQQEADKVDAALVAKWQAEHGVSVDRDSREGQMVVLRHKPDGEPTVWCDPEIADLVDALNNGTLSTIASCSGHGASLGWIAMKDGRHLLAFPTIDEAKRWISTVPVWRTMDSAPKDGTPLLLFARAGTATAPIDMFGWYLEGRGWIAQSLLGQDIVDIVPSHWMPRPPFPVEDLPVTEQEEAEWKRMEERNG